MNMASIPQWTFFQNHVVSYDSSNKSNSHVLPSWSTTDLDKTWGGHPFLANIKTNNMCIFNILKCLNKYLKNNNGIYGIYGLWSFSILTFQIWPGQKPKYPTITPVKISEPQSLITMMWTANFISLALWK